MASINDIAEPEQFLEAYCNPDAAYAWPLYDADPAPRVLSGADLAAPALLSYPVKGKFLNKMGMRGSNYHKLVELMASVLTAPEQRFWELDRNRLTSLATRKRGADTHDDAFGRFIACLDHVNQTGPNRRKLVPGLTSVFVTKVLHRKRPDLVPLNDSRLRDFYGVDNGYAELFASIHQDLNENFGYITDLANSIELEAGATPLRPLRVLDIVIWMYQTNQANSYVS